MISNISGPPLVIEIQPKNLEESMQEQPRAGAVVPDLLLVNNPPTPLETAAALIIQELEAQLKVMTQMEQRSQQELKEVRTNLQNVTQREVAALKAQRQVAALREHNNRTSRDDDDDDDDDDDEWETQFQVALQQEQEASRNLLQQLESELESVKKREESYQQQIKELQQQQQQQQQHQEDAALKEFPQNFGSPAEDASSNNHKHMEQTQIKELKTKLEIANAVEAKSQERVQELEYQLHLVTQREDSAQQQLKQLKQQQEDDAMAEFETNFANDGDAGNGGGADQEKYQTLIQALQEKLRHANQAKEDATQREEAAQQQIRDLKQTLEDEALDEFEKNFASSSDDEDPGDQKYKTAIQALEEKLLQANQENDAFVSQVKEQMEEATQANQKRDAKWKETIQALKQKLKVAVADKQEALNITQAKLEKATELARLQSMRVDELQEQLGNQMSNSSSLPQPERGLSNKQPTTQILKEVIASVPNEYTSQWGAYIVRRPFGEQSENKLFQSVSVTSAKDYAKKNWNFHNLEVAVTVKVDNAVVVLYNQQCIRYRTDASKDFVTIEQASDLPPQTTIRYFDTNLQTELEYSLPTIVQECMSVREHYFATIMNTASALQNFQPTQKVKEEIPAQTYNSSSLSSTNLLIRMLAALFGGLFRMVYWLSIELPLKVFWNILTWSISAILFGMAYQCILQSHNLHYLPDTSYFVNAAPGVV